MVNPATGMPLDVFGPQPVPMAVGMENAQPLPMESGMPSVRGPGVPPLDLNSGM
jgi:hypothetical protein